MLGKNNNYDGIKCVFYKTRKQCSTKKNTHRAKK